MGSSGEVTFKDVQKTLEPYIRPREEVARVRQILAAHLGSCLPGGAAVGPLALVDASNIDPSSTSRGLQKEYLEALSANIKARNELVTCCQGRRRPEKEVNATEQGLDRLQAHLATIRLRQRREKLQAIERGLNALGQKAAASPGFLDAGEIFRDSRPLPQVPNDLVTALTIDKATSGPQLKELIDQLEKHVLQTKLVLRREAQLLEKVKSRFTARAENISESAKFEALSRTRAELINWIEAELAKAGGDDGDMEGKDPQIHRAPTRSANIGEQLVSTKEKYTQYLDARRALLELASQQPQPVIEPPTKEAESQAPAATKAPPTAHLLSPYLEQLLSIAREQKGLIAQKTHLNSVISKQVKENSQVLDHLAEESQLIPAHSMPGVSRPHTALADATSNIESTGLADRAKPWIFAADAAKISTLEAVAEQIEEGQIALEGSMRTLGEIGQLLGQSPLDGKVDEALAGEEDLWLAASQPSGKTAGARKHTNRTEKKPAQPKTVWDKLDGNLGLLRSDKGTP
ncbi:hypothetical protein C8A03DRAFT_15628 [Achaetomium macrosporum]|uniref:Uncharacterized protein n=1 Tax=Achaetomium macrosporum TaxID=79813 RepID=A0AAN7C9E2_9PEZI|nr:hypothetical protein C8A03DRAFT_15628 [Achaetomium macrosporum]